jgi:hypothetical protein
MEADIKPKITQTTDLIELMNTTEYKRIRHNLT